jgi:hypothetical protein
MSRVLPRSDQSHPYSQMAGSEGQYNGFEGKRVLMSKPFTSNIHPLSSSAIRSFIEKLTVIELTVSVWSTIRGTTILKAGPIEDQQSRNLPPVRASSSPR